MSTTTATFGNTTVSTPATEPRKSLFTRFIEARTRQGEARVRGFFDRLSDAQLADLGFTPDQVRSLRSTGKVPVTFWA